MQFNWLIDAFLFIFSLRMLLMVENVHLDVGELGEDLPALLTLSMLVLPAGDWVDLAKRLPQQFPLVSRFMRPVFVAFDE